MASLAWRLIVWYEMEDYIDKLVVEYDSLWL